MALEGSKGSSRTVTAVRLPEELHRELRTAADDRDLSINYLIVKAVEEFLPRLIPAEELRLTHSPAAQAPGNGIVQNPTHAGTRT